MDVVRLGLGFRALRLRRRWRQSDVAAAVGVSRTLIARVERGRADTVTLRHLERIAAKLDSRLDVRLLWRGEALDRLLDARHAALVEATVRILHALAWLTGVEVSFNVRGERGSIDVLAFHPATRSLLVIEVKSVVPDLQAMLFALDRKVRLARQIARERGWDPVTISAVLVLPDDRTARRRLAAVAATLASTLPARTVEVRRWLKEPQGALRGVWFLTDVPQVTARQQVRAQRSPATLGSKGRS